MWLHPCATLAAHPHLPRGCGMLRRPRAECAGAIRAERRPLAAMACRVDRWRRCLGAECALSTAAPAPAPASASRGSRTCLAWPSVWRAHECLLPRRHAPVRAAEVDATGAEEVVAASTQGGTKMSGVDVCDAYACRWGWRTTYMADTGVQLKSPHRTTGQDAASSSPLEAPALYESASFATSPNNILGVTHPILQRELASPHACPPHPHDAPQLRQLDVAALLVEQQVRVGDHQRQLLGEIDAGQQGCSIRCASPTAWCRLFKRLQDNGQADVPFRQDSVPRHVVLHTGMFQTHEPVPPCTHAHSAMVAQVWHRVHASTVKATYLARSHSVAHPSC